MNSDILNLIDILGTISFAVSGVFAAMEKKLDIFGVLIIAFITAVGGGTLRDMMIGDLPVSWMRSIDYSIIITATVIVVIIFNNTIKNLHRTLLIFDSLGLGFFTILGIQKGIFFGLPAGICIALGTVTACFGGITRDIILNNIPIIFKKEIYATACITGGGAYLLLTNYFDQNSFAQPFSIVLIFLIRMVSVKYKLTLPTIYRERQSDKKEKRRPKG